MTHADLQRSLIELGWISLMHRVLGGKPAESYALHQLMRRAGADVSLMDLADGYDARLWAGGMIRKTRGRLSGSPGGVQNRIVRLRAALDDIGAPGAIKTVFGVGYRIEKRDVPRIEAAILGAAGFDVEALGLAA